MLNYTIAAERFNATRKRCNRIKIHSYGYLTYDPERDVYLVQYVQSRYEKHVATNKYTSLPPGKWVMKNAIEIHPDGRLVVTSPAGYCTGLLRDLLGIRFEKSKTVQYDGYYAVQGVHRVPVSLGEALHIVKGAVVANRKMTERVFDEAKRKETNALIARVRRLVQQRYKLGAFSSWESDYKAFNEKAGEDFGYRRDLQNAQSTLRILKSVDPSKIDSFRELFYLVMEPANWRMRERAFMKPFPEAFDAYIKAIREDIRRDTKEVQYTDVRP